MSEAATTTTEAPKSTEATIQDAVDAMFAEKAKSEPKPAETPAPEVKAEPETPAAEAPAETPAEEPKLPEAPKVSASDYALKLARIKKRETASANLAPKVSAEAIKRAAAIEAAGHDAVAAFEASGLDLATIVNAYEKKREEEPTNADPLAKEVKQLRDMLAGFQEREKEREAKESERETVAATQEFHDATRAIIKDSGDSYEYTAARGQEGLDVVKHLVLQSAKEGITLSLFDALKEAEAYFEEDAEPLLQTKKLAAKFSATPQTKKPGIPQQSPLTTPAPAAPTKPLSVSDVINQAVDALLG